jgi:sec-independent protein translocase protein TatA
VPFGLGIWEIVILAVILLLLFGGKGLPGMARRLGTGIKEVKDAVEEIDPRSMLDDKDEKQAAPKQIAPAEVVRPAEPVGEAEASPTSPEEVSSEQRSA